MTERAAFWEKEFTHHAQLWKEFHRRLTALEAWIDRAQAVIQEKQGDYHELIDKHQRFFQSVDDELLQGFIRAGQELLHIRARDEQEEIQLLMDTLQSQWNTIVGHAPIRLLRLRYERSESSLFDELKQVEDELNQQLKQLEQQRDTTEILRRHDEFFRSNRLQASIGSHLKELQACADDLRGKDGKASDDIDQRTRKLNECWTQMQTKMSNVRQKLQTIPKKWQEFDEK